MELLLALGAIVALDIAAFYFGADTRQVGPLDRHERALTALRHGDLPEYRAALKDLERESARLTPIRF
jgi:hypothetical protein